ncbi:unnamed protein product [Durusdinium trenchii]|uniref:Uncharacterized protein n=1 Tax=Durusdinium trenchii TaxID=1381693 RepID=A0ABP0KAP0_9DINO
MPHELCLQRLALLPEAVTSISALETGDVVLCSKSSVWVFPSHFHGQALAQVECEATCILALGSQTIAAGDHAKSSVGLLQNDLPFQCERLDESEFGGILRHS